MKFDESKYHLAYTDAPAPAKAPGTGRARLRLERAGRKGKTVTVIDGLALSDDQLRDLLRELQAACGTGGTVKEHRVELQGDCQARAKDLLARRGYRV